MLNFAHVASELLI